MDLVIAFVSLAGFPITDQATFGEGDVGLLVPQEMNPFKSCLFGEGNRWKLLGGGVVMPKYFAHVHVKNVFAYISRYPHMHGDGSPRGRIYRKRINSGNRNINKMVSINFLKNFCHGF